MKNILITGAVGFLGSIFVNASKEDFYVTGMDNFITGSKKIYTRLKIKNFRFINHDVSKYVEINDDLDYILHFVHQQVQ